MILFIVFLVYGFGDFSDPKCAETYTLNDITVKLYQQKKEFGCSTRLEILKNRQFVDSLSFQSEPVGGRYGISKGYMLRDHLVFSKHGDYDGGTIVINQRGDFIKMIGGIIYYDSIQNILFNIFESDLPGFSIFDLEADKQLIEKCDIEVRPLSFLIDPNHGFFMLCEYYESQVLKVGFWKVDIKKKMIEKVEMDQRSSTPLKKLPLINSEDVNCSCRKSNNNK